MKKKTFYYLLGFAIFGYIALFIAYFALEYDVQSFVKKVVLKELEMKVPLPSKSSDKVVNQKGKTFYEWLTGIFSSDDSASIQNKDIKWAYYINDPVLNNIKNSPFNLVVIDSELNGQSLTSSQLKPLQEKNKKIFAYVSLGQAEDYRSYWKKAWFKTKPAWLGDENRLWKGNYTVNDLMSKEWTDISKLILTSIINAGFDGIVISGIGTQKNSNIYLQRVSEFIKRKNPDFKIIIQDYFPIILMTHIDGVLKQNLVFNFNGDKLSEDTIQQNIELLKPFQEANKPVLIIEYISDKNWELAKTYINKNNFHGYSGPLQLNALRMQQ